MPAKKTRKFKKSSVGKSKVREKPILETQPSIPQASFIVETSPEQTETTPAVVDIVTPLPEDLTTQEPENETAGATETSLSEETNAKESKTDFLFSTDPVKEDEIKKVNDNKSKNQAIRVILLLLVFLLGLAIGGLVIYFWQSGKVALLTKSEPKTDKQLLPTVTPLPTETPFDLSKYSIAILNGSKIKGGAAKLKIELEESNFKVILVGNAESSAFKETIIKAKEDVDPIYLEKLKSFLSKEFVLAEVGTLKNSQKTDIVITVGEKVASEAQ